MSYPGANLAPGGAIDLRSDTVTRPSPGMRAAMAEAEVGDDVYGDDPTVARLEAEIAQRFGMEAAVLLPSGTQSNLIAVLSHCARGEEVLVGRGYHIEGYEARGTSVLGGVALEPLALRADQGIDPSEIAAVVKPADSHFPITRLLSLENTVGGRVVPLSTQAAAIAEARRHGLSIHLDGARVFNACTALGRAPAEVVAGVDSVSVCLSKGLGAPIGSVLTGSTPFIAQARRLRKMLGGGMRQAGVIAAAGLYALEHEVPRLAEDHGRADRLRSALADLPGLDVDCGPGQTNMVWLSVAPDRAPGLAEALAAEGVTISPGASLRLVLHRDVDDDGVAAVLAGFERFAESVPA